MGLTAKMILATGFVALNLACDDRRLVSGPPLKGTEYTATLLPAEVRLRPGQSVTFTFTALQEPGKVPVYLSSESLEWTLEGTPGYSVGSITGLPEPSIDTNRKGRFDAAPSLPEGVTQVQFTLRARIKALLYNQVVQATSKITLDVNAPLAVEPAPVQEGVDP